MMIWSDGRQHNLTDDWLDDAIQDYLVQSFYKTGPKYGAGNLPRTIKRWPKTIKNTEDIEPAKTQIKERLEAFISQPFEETLKGVSPTLKKVLLLNAPEKLDDFKVDSARKKYVDYDYDDLEDIGKITSFVSGQEVLSWDDYTKDITIDFELDKVEGQKITYNFSGATNIKKRMAYLKSLGLEQHVNLELIEDKATVTGRWNQQELFLSEGQQKKWAESVVKGEEKTIEPFIKEVLKDNSVFEDSAPNNLLDPFAINSFIAEGSIKFTEGVFISRLRFTTTTTHKINTTPLQKYRWGERAKTVTLGETKVPKVISGGPNIGLPAGKMKFQHQPRTYSDKRHNFANHIVSRIQRLEGVLE